MDTVNLVLLIINVLLMAYFINRISFFASRQDEFSEVLHQVHVLRATTEENSLKVKEANDKSMEYVKAVNDWMAERVKKAIEFDKEFNNGADNE